MRKTILTAAASAAITAALCFASIGSAEAMTPGSASGVRAALAQTNLTESVARCYRPCPGCALVCRRGYYRGYYGYPGYYGGRVSRLLRRIRPRRRYLWAGGRHRNRSRAALGLVMQA